MFIKITSDNTDSTYYMRLKEINVNCNWTGVQRHTAQLRGGNSGSVMFQDLSNYFDEYKVIITSRNDGFSLSTYMWPRYAVYVEDVWS